MNAIVIAIGIAFLSVVVAVVGDAMDIGLHPGEARTALDLHLGDAMILTCTLEAPGWPQRLQETPRTPSGSF